jgi:dihydrolipoamide dehydrogenase
VRTERGYVTVDDALMTSAPHVFAAGDVTGRMMLVQSATYEGTLAAENAALGAERGYRHAIVPHGGFTDPEYAGVGLTEDRARDEVGDADCAVAVVPYADLDRGVIDGRPEGMCKLVVSRSSRRVLGAHIVGEQAVEVVQLAAAAMRVGMPVEQLADLELAYPTFKSIVGLAARRIVRELDPASPRQRASGPSSAAEWEHSERG